MVIAPDVDVEERQRVQPEDQQARHRDRGETASTDVRPSSDQYTSWQMQDQGELVENQRRADTEKDCGGREFGYPPSTASVTIVTPETMTKITPITTWWMCSDAMADVARLPPLARRVAVGVRCGCTARSCG